jgi:hypothetical protein
MRPTLWIEPLEARLVLSGFEPTPVEQLFLEQLNDARANPAAYGATIGVDLSGVAPSQPLAFDTRLVEAARLHSQDMNARAYFSHITPEGYDPGQRMAAAGFPWTTCGESLAGGSADPEPSDALRNLISDDHRQELLAIDPISRTQNQVGVGIVLAGAGPLINYYTIDMASSADWRPILTGVVMNDANGNGKYDIGEGLAGVTITVSGLGSTTTFASGGYSLAVNPGVYTVTASGGGLAAPITRTVAVGTSNYRLNFVDYTAYIGRLYQTILGRTGSAAEVAGWVGAMQGTTSPAGVASAFEHSAEARARLVATWYATYLGRVPAMGEVQAWVAAMMSGLSEEQAQADILGSNEFAIRTNSQGSGEKYIESLFTLLLGRSPTPSELQSVLAILSTEDRTTLALGFLSSAEYRADTISQYYVGLLHRMSLPSVQEIGGWVASGLGLTDIRVALESSMEFFLNG